MAKLFRAKSHKLNFNFFAMNNRSIQKKLLRISNLASQGLWFPNSSEKMSGITVDSEVTEIQTYINARKGFDRGIIDETRLNSLPGSSLKQSLSDRARGALIGTAVGDALGTTIEFTTPGTFEPVSEITGGGPFKLKAGEWTDDSSMMLCLAHSLTRKQAFDLKDQIDLYMKWWKEGTFSVTASCFDIGMIVQSALQEYEQTGNPEAGPDDPYSAGNGSLMRLAPIPVFFHSDFEDAVSFSGKSSLTTHRATEAVDTCRYFGGLIWGALNGASKNELLNGLYSPNAGYWDREPLCASVNDLILSENYKEKSASQVRGSGYVMHSLEAVLWAFSTTDTFEEGLLKAVNLGEDADTTGAIFGQIGGAYYGEQGIPQRWVSKVKHNYFFYMKADELVKISS